MGAIKNTRNTQKTQLDVCIGKEGLTVGEVEEFAPSFEHSEMDKVKTLCR